MKALTRLESFIQELVERPAWLLTPRRLHPLEMAAALNRSIEADALAVVDRVVIPDRYTLYVNPEDHTQLAAVLPTLSAEFGGYVRRIALERGLTLNAAPAIQFAPDAKVRPGSVRVVSAFAPAEESRSQARATAVRRPAAQPAEHTTRLRPPTSVASGASLEVLGEGGRVVERWPLNGAPVVIGRRRGNGLTLMDSEVSREHALVEFLSPRYYLRDLGSTNGTHVNGRPVSGPHPLADGDTIEVGHTRLRFRRGG